MSSPPLHIWAGQDWNPLIKMEQLVNGSWEPVILTGARIEVYARVGGTDILALDSDNGASEITIEDDLNGLWMPHRTEAQTALFLADSGRLQVWHTPQGGGRRVAFEVGLIVHEDLQP